MKAAQDLGERIDFTQALHTSTKRDYVARVVEFDKADCAEVASRFGQEYWDGERQYGYGGYRYDGRWRPIAERMAEHYGLKAGMRLLDVGCGKGFLLHEFTQVVPGLKVAGLDISAYGIENSKEEVRSSLVVGHAKSLPFEDNSFDLVISLGTLHNLGIEDLWSAVSEIERVGRDNKYIMIESFRNQREKANLLYWQLTCKSFYSVEDWEWLYRKIGYSGDYGFIFFE
ncbi:MAG TPA: class I SAM-dependent methyltransferase [Candidatus Lustribacter sp.]|jgi:SAM-dependent methyltransferase|nr:class I SAM-dependent methyltransferase [Candidatus Lustribacter sp.]